MQPQITDDLLNLIASLQNRLEIVEKALTNDAIQVGSIIEWPGPTTLLPFNYFPADGRAIDRIGYAAYFAQVGTTFGVGDGSSTFNIPKRGPRIYLDAGATRSGCVALDGTSYLRATFPDLFTWLGGASSPWGLPDGTHFNVPDLRGRVPVGAGTGSGLTARTLGTQNIGEETHLLTAGESGLPSHQHNYIATTGAGGLGGGGVPPHNGVPATTSAVDAAGPTSASSAHNNMQPTGVYNFFIETTNTQVVKVL